MISEHEILENGNKQQRCQVVRWVRTFPFSFLSKREYIIGRRMWRSPDGCLYGITKVVIFSHRLSPSSWFHFSDGAAACEHSWRDGLHFRASMSAHRAGES